MAENKSSWGLVAGLGLAGAGLLALYLATKPKTTAVQPGDTVGIKTTYKNVGPFFITQRWRTTIEDTAMLGTPQEGPWTEYVTLAPGEEVIVSPERTIPTNWGAPMKINLRLDTEGDIDKDSIKSWPEYFEIR